MVLHGSKSIGTTTSTTVRNTSKCLAQCCVNRNGRTVLQIDPMEHTGERMVPESSDSNTFWEHIDRYRFASRWVKSKRVLDIASGEGYGTRGLLEAGAKH